MTIIDTVAAGPDGRLPYQDKSEIEIWKPPTNDLKGYFDVEVLDPNGVTPRNIIKEAHAWQIRFHVFLVGDIWKCVCGTLCFDVLFERARNGDRTSLSSLVGGDVELEFKGCDHFVEGAPGRDGYVHVTHTVDIRPGALPAGEDKPAIYDWRGVLSFRDPCEQPGVMSSFDSGIVQVWGH